MLKKVTAATYSFNEVGERTKTEPASGPATTYGYDQAGNLISVTRPKGTEVAAIEDTYGYSGEGLRTSETLSGTTTYLAWDLAEKLPLILNDGTNSYIYGPEGLPVEQINNSTSTILYLHHDQQGSTRLLTGSTGKVEGKCTYGAYGVSTCEGAATTPLGYDGQYTNGDTGLIYLRARNYDPATAQFMSVDPRSMETLAAYGYAEDNPVTVGDPTGLIPWAKKVKEAIAKCGQLKSGPMKNNRNNPFYHNKSFYQSCEDLLHLPKEVYGSNAHGSGSSVHKYLSGVVQVVAGAATIAAGVIQTTFCLGGEVETDTGLHCIGVSTAVLSTGGVIFYHGAKEILESGVPQEVFVSNGTP